VLHPSSPPAIYLSIDLIDGFLLIRNHLLQAAGDIQIERAISDENAIIAELKETVNRIGFQDRRPLGPDNVAGRNTSHKYRHSSWGNEMDLDGR